MPQLILYLSEKENKIINFFSKKWTVEGKKLSKHETIKRIINNAKSQN